MWFPFIIALAVGLTAIAPRFAKGLAWVITISITVPLVMLGAGSIGYLISLCMGMGGSWESFVMCCFVCGIPPAVLICWVIFG